MTFDVEHIRKQFPALKLGAAHFDGPGGTLTPTRVAQATFDFLNGPHANRTELNTAGQKSEASVIDARNAMADLLGADPSGIVFGRSMTSLTFDFARTLSQDWHPGDEIVVSRADHDANVRPWVIYAQKTGATLRWIDFDPATGYLDVSDVESVVNDRTKLVAMTGASNLIGSRPDLPVISKIVHSVGALLYVDGVHLTPHSFVDVHELGADFYGCAPYKFWGPHIGVMAASPTLLDSLHPDKLLPSTEQVPERFELGTLPYEQLVAITAAVDFIADMVPSSGSRRQQIRTSMDAIEAYEDSLSHRLREGLASIPEVTVYSNAPHKTPTELFSISNVELQTADDYFATHNINALSSSFYAIETSRHLGLGDEGAIRAGLAPYNIQDDVDRLLTCVADLAQGKTV
ncbi:MAG: cysteine desulfurase-like protein [Actinobacteria bacterium]|uniref:Unannotated protein n=1 Tax=freshwater metagenome TaxID=449393 RepID=A0A6J5Z5N2_9ZZZZ|nr:cysteine desulfurase-like protein [Actinomycetota bacterium]